MGSDVKVLTALTVTVFIFLGAVLTWIAASEDKADKDILMGMWVIALSISTTVFLVGLLWIWAT